MDTLSHEARAYGVGLSQEGDRQDPPSCDSLCEGPQAPEVLGKEGL